MKTVGDLFSSWSVLSFLRCFDTVRRTTSAIFSRKVLFQNKWKMKTQVQLADPSSTGCEAGSTGCEVQPADPSSTGCDPGSTGCDPGSTGCEVQPADPSSTGCDPGSTGCEAGSTG